MEKLIHILRRHAWLLFVLAVCGGWRSARGEKVAVPEYKLKAAFLYNFVVLTEWPAQAFESIQSPLVIGVVGEDPFGDFLEEATREKIVGGRKIEIKHFKKVEEIQRCQLLFIAESESGNVSEIIAGLGGRPILTVSEIDRFNYFGGIIWLRKEENQIKFRIRRSAAKRVNLKLSSRLLALSLNAAAKSEVEE